MSRTHRSEAIVLRSLRYGEADRILHLLTRDQGRVSAIAKGARRTRSKLGGRLEPLSHVAVLFHRGAGEMVTITGADLLASHDAVRADGERLAVALVGIEAVLRLFPEEAADERLFDGLVRFLDVVGGASGADPAVALAFCLKLIALAGWAPRLDACASCGNPPPLVRYSARAGGAVCATCQGFPVSDATLTTVARMLATPLDLLGPVDPAVLGQLRRIVDETSAEHTGHRLRGLG
jgi:DNA repair protein RecO (recombination protein O)